MIKTVEQLRLPNGKAPFAEWLLNLDKMSQSTIQNYIERVANGGGKKNIKSLGDGVFEIKINFGPGYRVYFGEYKNFIILLILGGNKSSQKHDIKTAKKLWRNYV